VCGHMLFSDCRTVLDTNRAGPIMGLISPVEGWGSFEGRCPDLFSVSYCSVPPSFLALDDPSGLLKEVDAPGMYFRAILDLLFSSLRVLLLSLWEAHCFDLAGEDPAFVPPAHLRVIHSPFFFFFFFLT